ncbi:unnamed protein product [Withania somnifera]
MDAIVNSLNKAYEELVTATTIVLETREANGGQKPEGVDPSVESFQQHLLLFKASCDEAQGFVEYLKHSLGCEKFSGNLSYFSEHADEEKTSKTNMSTSKSLEDC